MKSDIGKVQRLNLADQTADVLRSAIIQGALLPGTHLVETDLSQKLGVSRGPLREALRILELEGLVESSPGRGSYVIELSKRDIRELYSLRSILEQKAACILSRKITSKQIAELQDALDAMFVAARQGDLSQVIERDLGFHRMIWEMANNHKLQQVLEGLYNQISFYLAVNTRLHEDLALGIADHQAVLNAIIAGEEEVIERTISEHLADAVDLIIEAFYKEDPPN